MILKTSEEGTMISKALTGKTTRAFATPEVLAYEEARLSGATVEELKQFQRAVRAGRKKGEEYEGNRQAVVGQILADIDDANRSVTHLEATPRGVLRLNGPTVFGRLHIAPHLPEFLARYPEIDIDLTLTDHFVDVIEEGADVVVRVGGLSDSSLFARRLAPNRRILCATPAYLDRAGRPESANDLTKHACVVYKLQSTTGNWHICCGESGELQEVKVTGRLAANNAEALHAAVLGDVGIALLPTWLVGDDIQSGQLERVLPTLEADLTPDETAIHAIYPHKRLLSAKVRAFVDFLVEKYQPTPYWEIGGDAAEDVQEPALAK
jgi:DNA-binding transcriptional LysR family regulator